MARASMTIAPKVFRSHLSDRGRKILPPVTPPTCVHAGAESYMNHADPSPLRPDTHGGHGTRHRQSRRRPPGILFYMFRIRNKRLPWSRPRRGNIYERIEGEDGWRSDELNHQKMAHLQGLWYPKECNSPTINIYDATKDLQLRSKSIWYGQNVRR